MKPSEREVRWAVELFAALFPPDPEAGARLGAADLPMGAFYVDQIQATPPPVALGYRAVIAMIYMLPVLVIGRPRFFGGLSALEKEVYLTRLMQSRWYFLRETLTLVKMIAGTGFLGFPEVQRQFGVEHDDAVAPVEVPS
ncbi:MAG: hypothetical protein KC466_06750 [Myxococcales bacterium]|nr:hypothetical protein [Myxococcales bacterium]